MALPGFTPPDYTPPGYTPPSAEALHSIDHLATPSHVTVCSTDLHTEMCAAYKQIIATDFKVISRPHSE